MLLDTKLVMLLKWYVVIYVEFGLIGWRVGVFVFGNSEYRYCGVGGLFVMGDRELSADCDIVDVE